MSKEDNNENVLIKEEKIEEWRVKKVEEEKIKDWRVKMVEEENVEEENVEEKLQHKGGICKAGLIAQVD